MDVVEDEKLRAGAGAVGGEVVGVGIESVLQGDVAQGAAADAQDDENFAAGAEMFDGLVHLVDHFAFVGKIAIRKLAGAALLVHFIGDFADVGGDFFQIGGGEVKFGGDGGGGEGVCVV